MRRSGVWRFNTCCISSVTCISRCTLRTITMRAETARLRRLPGCAANNLHHDWDSEFVARLGANEVEIAQRLIAGISDAQRRRWSAGTPSDWAIESFVGGKITRLRLAAGTRPAQSLRA